MAELLMILYDSVLEVKKNCQKIRDLVKTKKDPSPKH